MRKENIIIPQWLTVVGCYELRRPLLKLSELLSYSLSAFVQWPKDDTRRGEAMFHHGRDLRQGHHCSFCHWILLVQGLFQVSPLKYCIFYHHLVHNVVPSQSCTSFIISAIGKQILNLTFDNLSREVPNFMAHGNRICQLFDVPN